MKRILLLLPFLIFAAGILWAEEITVQMHLVDDRGVGKKIGTITATDTPYGLLLAPDLSGLPPGVHGFHVHENPTCQPDKKEDGQMAAAHAAGGHYDPKKSGKHAGPYREGHLGDLPVLYVASEGTSTIPVLAPRVKVADLKGRALMIHQGGDNYDDQPKPLGGGGGRTACVAVK